MKMLTDEINGNFDVSGTMVVEDDKDGFISH
jgi:hypothetical protein